MRTLRPHLALLACLSFFLTMQAGSGTDSTRSDPSYAVRVDSLTYQFYLNGQWEDLRQVAKEAIRQGVDFKYLRQRLGYAAYASGNFYESMKQYRLALKMDSADPNSLLYLHYAGLETGNTALARYYGGKLTEATQEALHLHAVRAVKDVDLEVNHQWNAQTNRSDPDFRRIGFGSDLGYTCHLYQSVSLFSQDAWYRDTYNEYRSSVTQKEYFALLSKQFGPNIGVDLGYHHLATHFKTQVWDLSLDEPTETIDTLDYPGHLFLAGLRYRLNRMYLDWTTSWLDLSYNHVLQHGLQVGYALPLRQQVFLTGALYRLQDDEEGRWVSKFSIGTLCFKRCWVDVYKTFGNLDNFTDLNGLYVYNSFDPSSSRMGISLFGYGSRHFTLFVNYAQETKTNSYLLNTYTQSSLTGGILWKF